MGAVARRPRPSLRALLFGCGGGAVLGQTASFLVGSESDVRQWGLWPTGPVRPSGPCCFAVARAPFLSLGGWKTASFLVGSESNVRHWGPWPAGPVRLSGFWCLAVAKASFLGAVARRPGPSLRALLFGCGGGAVLGQTTSFLVGSESDVRQWGGRGPQARSVLQGPAVSLWFLSLGRLEDR